MPETRAAPAGAALRLLAGAACSPLVEEAPPSRAQLVALEGLANVLSAAADAAPSGLAAVVRLLPPTQLLAPSHKPGLLALLSGELQRVAALSSRRKQKGKRPREDQPAGARGGGGGGGGGGAADGEPDLAGRCLDVAGAALGLCADGGADWLESAWRALLPAAERVGSLPAAVQDGFLSVLSRLALASESESELAADRVEQIATAAKQTVRDAAACVRPAAISFAGEARTPLEHDPPPPLSPHHRRAYTATARARDASSTETGIPRFRSPEDS